MCELCRTLIDQLDKVNPSRLCHEEKLAFWLNVYNAILMHVRGGQAWSIDLTQLTSNLPVHPADSHHPLQFELGNKNEQPDEQGNGLAISSFEVGFGQLRCLTLC